MAFTMKSDLEDTVRKFQIDVISTDRTGVIGAFKNF